MAAPATHIRRAHRRIRHRGPTIPRILSATRPHHRPPRRRLHGRHHPYLKWLESRYPGRRTLVTDATLPAARKAAARIGGDCLVQAASAHHFVRGFDFQRSVMLNTDAYGPRTANVSLDPRWLSLFSSVVTPLTYIPGSVCIIHARLEPADCDLGARGDDGVGYDSRRLRRILASVPPAFSRSDIIEQRIGEANRRVSDLNAEANAARLVEIIIICSPSAPQGPPLPFPVADCHEPPPDTVSAVDSSARL